jgi:hypothetical protein
MCVAVRAERLLSPFRTSDLASHVGWPWNNVRFARRRGVSVKGQLWPIVSNLALDVFLFIPKALEIAAIARVM